MMGTPGGLWARWLVLQVLLVLWLLLLLLLCCTRLLGFWRGLSQARGWMHSLTRRSSGAPIPSSTKDVRRSL